MTNPELKALLDELADKYNRPSFIAEDPISVPRSFTARRDIEISGLLTALFAWGNRKSILRSAGNLMQLMDHCPAMFVTQASDAELECLTRFVHRTMNGTDMKGLVLGLREIYRRENGLELSFALQSGETDTYPAISRFRNLMLPFLASRSRKHIADPGSGASAKRIHMFLRWMVRNDHRGVDFGIWTAIPPSALMLPLDVHTGTIARQLGLLIRKQNDRKAVQEVMKVLRNFDPMDPVRYDFALFGLGIDLRWKQAYNDR